MSMKHGGSCQNRKYLFLDEINEHPYETGLSLALVVYGIGLLFIAVPDLPHFPSWFIISSILLFCVLAIIGGSSVIVAKTFRHKYLWAYGLERAGLYISASAWGTAAALGIVSNLPHIAFNLIINDAVIVILAIASLVRARAIGKKADVILNALRTAAKQKEAGE